MTTSHPRALYAFAGLCTAALLLAAPLARAQTAGNDLIYKTITGDQLQKLMEAKDYTVSLDEDMDIVWEIDGNKAYVIVSKNRESLLFRIAFTDDTTLQRINAWNQSKVFSRSYMDDEGDPVLELDLDLAGGVTKARIYDYLDTCIVSLQAWIDEVL